MLYARERRTKTARRRGNAKCLREDGELNSTCNDKSRPRELNPEPTLYESVALPIELGRLEDGLVTQRHYYNWIFENIKFASSSAARCFDSCNGLFILAPEGDKCAVSLFVLSRFY